MKRYTLIILAALLSMLGTQPMSAQQTQDALYIFRNDGGFHGFFYSEIDRIDYSKIDTLGVEQSDYVVQEVYARDTVYRIPISAIDSVAFVTPENIVKNDVAYSTEADIWNYVIKSDTLYTFVLSPSTPSSMIPKVGDKMVKTEPTPYMPHGVYATVESIENKSDGITVVCTPTAIGELFDQFTAKVAVVSDDSPAASRARRSEDMFDSEYVALGVHLNEDFGNFINLASASVGDGTTVLFTGKGNIKLDITPIHKIYAFMSSSFVTGELHDFQIGSKIITDFDLNVEGKLTLRQDLALPKLQGYLGTTPFLLHAQVGLTGSVATELKYKHHIHDESRIVANYTYANRYPLETTTAALASYLLDGETRHEAFGSYRNLAYSSTISLALKGTIQVGVFATFGVSLIGGDVADLSVRNEVGKRATVEAEVDNQSEYVIPAQYTESSTHYYDLLNKDNSVRVANYSSSNLIATTGPKSWKYGKTVNLYNKEFGTPFEGGLVPGFADINFNHDEKTNKATASARIRRSILTPVTVGFALYNAKTKKIIGTPAWYGTQFADKDGTLTFSKYNMDFKGIEGGQTVRVYPTVKDENGGYEILATPYNDFEIEPKMYFFTGDSKYNTMMKNIPRI